jgi:hypothetical protein
MSEPTRLIDEAEGVGLARDLLGAARGEGLGAGQKRAIWTGIAAQALTAATPAAAGVAGAKALGVGAVVKTALVIVALAGGVVVGARALHRSAPQLAPAPRSSPEGAALAPAPASASPVSAAAPYAVALRTVRPIATPPRPSPASRLTEESRVVLEARRALRAGDAATALRGLEAARATFAGGALAQEREALAIEALGQLGEREAAAARARVFLRAYPGSPHAAAVGKLAAP